MFIFHYETQAFNPCLCCGRQGHTSRPIVILQTSIDTTQIRTIQGIQEIQGMRMELRKLHLGKLHKKGIVNTALVIAIRHQTLVSSMI